MYISCDKSLLIKILRKPATLSEGFVYFLTCNDEDKLLGAVQLVQDSILSFGVSAIVDHYGYGDGIRQFLI